ncbi:MAG: translocation/assembly module TamB domain-containing protein [Cyclobacteriaceae bacterium]|nr:translocation/assembly module TamB domain-containing protein [Cyclobacteriaceae bacterium]
MKDKKKFRLIRVLLQVILILLINLVLLLGILQISAVQTRLGRMLAKNISQKTGFDISIGKLDIQWLDKLTLKDVAIIDLTKNEMIQVNNLLVDYRISSLLGDESIVIDKAILDKPIVNLLVSDSLDLNISEFIDRINKGYSGNGSGKAKSFIIRSAIIHNGIFSYNRTDRPNIDNGFDYYHFGFDTINATTKNLTVVADTFNLDIRTLSAIEKSTKLPIHSLACDYRLSKSQMAFNGLNASIGGSIIKDTLSFSYDSILDLNDFVNKVNITGKFDNLKLATQDLKYFTSYFNSINDTLHFTGVVKGKINDFRSENLTLGFGKSSILKGNVYFEGLPDIPNTFMDLKFSKSNIHKNDIAPYIASEGFDKYNPIDSAKVDGTFTGYVHDFVTYGSFNTSIGLIKTDLNLKIGNDPADGKYSGRLALENFDLGKVAGNESLVGKTTLEGNINGAGFSTTNADFLLKGTIKKIRVEDYTYRNIQTNAHFAFGLFDGKLNINDPNLQFETSGKIDLRNNRNQIQMNGQLKKAVLDSLHLKSNPAGISGNIEIDVKGIALDSIVGSAHISNLYAYNNDQELYVNDIRIVSDRTESNRSLSFKSDRVDLDMNGDFNFTKAVKDLRNLWLEYKYNLLNQETDIAQFYKGVENEAPSTNFTYDIKLYDINPLINLFVPELYFSEDTHINGNVQSGTAMELALNMDADTVKYEDNFLIKNHFQLHTSTDVQKRGVEAIMSFNSSDQVLESGAELENLQISSIWKKDTLDFKIHLKQEEQLNENSIHGRFAFARDTTILTILPSTLQLLEEKWHIQENNKIVFTKDKVELSNIRLYNQNQELSAVGYISKTSNEPIKVYAKNVNIGILNPILPNKLEGTLNGNVQVSNIYSTPLIEANLKIDSLLVDGFSFGDIEGKSLWNGKKKAFDISFFVVKQNSRLIDVAGTYKPLGDTNALNLKAQLVGTNLQIAEPFTKGLFSNIQGTVSGNMFITGPLFAPVLTGNGNLNDASLTIDYLKATYNFNGKWSIGKDVINLSDINLNDKDIGTGTLNARFNHKNFKDFSMDLKASFSNLITLNTEAKDNNLYYGTAVGSGELSIAGPIDNIVITARARTEKGTRFFIPLTDSEAGVKQEDYITFNSFTKKGNLNDPEDEKPANFQLSGITFNLDVEITPDAYAEIIFDRTAGDIIRGRGIGNLSLGIDTKGDFTVIGEYEFTEGAYNFTMYNIVNKEFTINPKSKIIWSGDPYQGDMDIKAIYKVNTNLAPLMTNLDSTYQKMPEVNRIYPSYVLLDLDGPLLSPEIKFDILIEDYPKTNADIDTQVRAFLNKIHNDEQEMNRQVFSLLVLRKFSSPNSFTAGSTIGSSVSEFVSNQLSYWISQVDENLTIDIDLSQLNAEALQTFQLRVSYSFLDGKLIVTRDGGFTDQNQQATLASITGDWTVEYLLSQDGRLRVKLFKRTNYDQVTSSTSTDQDLITGGFSLLYTTSFDSIKELFSKNKNSQSNDSDTPDQKNDALKPEDSFETP